MESVFVKKMSENYGYFGGLSILYGILFALCLYKNPNGITYPLFVFITIGISYMLLKKIGFAIKKDTWMYVAGMVLLGIGTAMTSSWFLGFFNSAGIFLLFLTAMMHQFHEDGKWDFPIYVKELFKICIRTVGHIFYPFTHAFRYLAGSKEGKRKNIAAVCFGILIAGALLLIVFPMLLKSDMIFAGIFERVLWNIHFSSVFSIGFMVLVGFISSYAFFSALCSSGRDEIIEEKRNDFNSLIGITFTSVLAIIYLLYAMIQVFYLFLRIDSGLPNGVTYAEYARQGFFELLFVGIINFVLVLTCKYLFDANKVLYGILTAISGCTFVMLVSAFYRMMLYVQIYHFTFLRMLVLWCLIVLALIMSGVVLSIYRKSFPLFRYIVLVVGCGYILFSFAKPDRLVAEYNIRHMETVSMQDLYYMIYELSDDAAPALAKLDPQKIDSSYDTDADIYENWDVEGAAVLREYYGEVADKYEDLSIRQWNLSKVQARNAAIRAGDF